MITFAIDGEELKANDDPYRLLRNKADNPVQLTLMNAQCRAREQFRIGRLRTKQT